MITVKELKLALERYDEDLIVEVYRNGKFGEVNELFVSVDEDTNRRYLAIGERD
jgi:stress response protein SCP2